MREVIAILLVVLVLLGLVFAWRRALAVRRRDSHTVRYRLVGQASEDDLLP